LVALEELEGMAGMVPVAVPVEPVEVPEWGWAMVKAMALALEPVGLDCRSHCLSCRQ